MDALLHPDLWDNLFTFENGVSLFEKMLRPVLMYVVLVALWRVLGNRESSQVNAIDLVVILSITNAVQNAIIGEDHSLIGGVVAAVVLLGVNRLSGVLKHRFPRFEAVVEGPTLVLVKDGVVQEEVLRRHHITRKDLRVMAHQSGLADVAEIDSCVLDSNGTALVEGKGILNDETFRHNVLAELKHLREALAEARAAAGPPPGPPAPRPPAP